MTRPRKDWRHQARAAALQILYQWEVGRTDVTSAAETFFGLQWPDREPPSDEMQAFAAALAHDTVRRLADADAMIAETAERWRPERMAVIDRLILRMAIAEMMRADQVAPDAVPAAVIINEALELARTFSTEDAVKFINGMLDAVRKKIEGSPGR